MKTMRMLLLAASLAAVSQAESLLLSDFSNFYDPATVTLSGSFYDGPWSVDTTLSGPTSFTIADFGHGTPSASSGNAFIKWLGNETQDWSAYTTIELTGLTLAGNATATLNFQIEDANGFFALTSFNLADFVGGISTVSVAINSYGIDLTQVTHWGFQVDAFESPAPAFAFEFDNLALSTVVIPEPSTVAIALGGVAFAAGMWRRRRTHA